MPLYERALKIEEKALGPDHLEVAKSLNNLAELLRDQGKHGEAMPLFKQSLKVLEKVLGPDHHYVATILRNIAVSSMLLGQCDEALKDIKRAVVIFERSVGPEHPNTKEAREKYISLEQSMGMCTLMRLALMALRNAT